MKNFENVKNLHEFNDERMYTYLKGYAMGKNMPETLNALVFARKLHKKQFRNSGEPYITHPLTMACQAIAMGLDDDEIIATLLLHDVVEDCGVSVNDLEQNNRVKEAVRLLSFRKPKNATEEEKHEAKKSYYYNISMNRIAAICKIFDRCNNVSTMAGVFTQERLMGYIQETDEFVLPLLRSAKESYPEYQQYLFILKYHIQSVLEAILGTMKTFDISMNN